MSLESFGPTGTVTLAAGTTTASVALASMPRGGTVRVASPSTNALCFIRFGDSSVVATTSDTPILPGTVEVFSVGVGSPYVAAISGTASQTLYFTSGDGV